MKKNVKKMLIFFIKKLVKNYIIEFYITKNT